MLLNHFKLFVFCLFVFAICSCDKTNPIDEPAGSAEYFIKNQTVGELSIALITSEQLGLEVIDTISNLETGQTKLIFMDGIIGVNPKPSDSFSELSFTLNNNPSDQYKISDIIDVEWIILETFDEELDYGLTKFELVITDEDFE